VRISLARTHSDRHLILDVQGMSMGAARERLPDRRACEGFDLEALGLRFHATVGRFPDGRLAEVFITNHKAGSMAGILASDSAVLCSIALQYGAPLDVIRKALMRDPRGNASSPLGVALDRLAEEGA
jgi:hypothetical protein